MHANIRAWQHSRVFHVFQVFNSVGIVACVGVIAGEGKRHATKVNIQARQRPRMPVSMHANINVGVLAGRPGKRNAKQRNKEHRASNEDKVRRYKTRREM